MDDSNIDHGYFDRSSDKKISIQSNQDCDDRPSDEDAPHDLWDSLESDTESLVQEKAYQRDLTKDGILTGVCDSINSYNDFMEKSEQEEDSDPQPDISEPRESQNTKYSRQSPWDEYADLRYDPDWRKKLRGSEFFQTDFSSDFNNSLRHAGHVYPKAEYLIVHSPVSSELDTVNPKPLQSSFHQYSKEDQVTALSVAQSSPASLDSIPRSNSDQSKNGKHRTNHQQSSAGFLLLSSPERQPDRENRGIVQDPNRDKLNAVIVQRRQTEKIRSTWLREDIVERNKATLGMNIHKQGSYLKAHEQRGAKPDDAKQPLQSAEHTARTDSTGSPDNTLNPELMWIQKTQKLKIHNQNKHLDRAKHHHHRTKPRGHLNQQVEKQQLPTPPENQCLSSELDSGNGPHSSSSSTPAVNFNINLNTPATIAEPSISLEPQKHLYTLAPPSSPHWEIRNDGYNSPFKGLSYTLCISGPPDGTVDHESIQMTNKNSNRISPTQPPFQESFTLNALQPGVHYKAESRDPAVVLQPYSGAYPVLPPIAVSNNSDPELCIGRAEETSSTTIHRSSSEGYLAQLEKQKQIQAKTSYKAYTLKEYKGLIRDVKLGGLGPSNVVATDLAEKIRQQKLYSDVIREQNKKISRIPSLPTRDPMGKDIKNNIPRNKALEYAKTITKPKAPQLKERPKDKPESESVFEHSASLQFKVDLTHLSTIEMLRKRHEQEKQVVASFTNIHGKSTASSISSH